MKVVLFCGGQGMRMREFSETLPKPMVPIGSRPIIWHLMKYYAEFGHKEFILCLGYKGEVIQDYFMNHDEGIDNNLVVKDGSTKLELLNREIGDWKITFADTGLTASIGQRLRAVREHVEGEEMFLANYADGLTDAKLPALVDDFRGRPESVVSFLCVRPSQTFHVVTLNDGAQVADITAASETDLWVNGGFFVMRPSIFDYLGPGEDLVEEPFRRLITEGRLNAYPYEGFWAGMDTFKDRQILDSLYTGGDARWEVWKHEMPLAAVQDDPD